MGRKRKDFTDKFKIEVAKEALKKRAKEAEVAAKYNIAPARFVNGWSCFWKENWKQTSRKPFVKKMKSLSAIFIKSLESKARSRKAPYGKFPYLLRNKLIAFPNQVIATDITYIKTPWGMMYFTAVIDLYSRKILSWRLSDSMMADFCLECVREAFEKYGVPAVFNTDCGSQYTSGEFIELLKSYNVEISMDGIGRCKDNIFVERTWCTLKYEWIFLRDYRSEEELRKLLGDFVKFFNNERIHQGLDYKTPDEVYREGSFFSAIIKKMVAA